ncbi:hypothetical protein C3B51_06795 [Pseudoalteromonas rubra]|uniref:AcrB/AcrD/AcrF family protein n=1 Tax=Pseudoalteromonas rubra TaxID=43658 RepID=A0A4Q7EHD1_9GAMM|nr:efflux RND transporter permease subunit [Pseudoalteromonas rubra]RZM83324.1 hypothetical protein C3B51_06795 [Pseudoalteromonas rubra]
MNALKKYQVPILFIAALCLVIGIMSSQRVSKVLLPEMKLPEIGLAVTWPGKSISEVEKSLIIPLERELAGIANVKSTVSWVEKGQSWTSVTFHSNTDMTKAYSEIQTKVNQVPNWPLEAPKPLIFDFSNGASSTLASFFLHARDDVPTVDFIEVFKDEVEPALIGIKGVAAVKVPNQSTRLRLNILFDEKKLVHNNVTIDEVITALDDLYDQSGDKLHLGKRAYQMVFKGEEKLNQLGEVIIKANGQQLVRVKDVATTEIIEDEEWLPTSYNGRSAMFFFIQPTNDVDVLETISLVKEKLVEMNRKLEKRNGFRVDLRMDNSLAIIDSLKFISFSSMLGLALACIAIFAFIRNVPSIGLVFASVPFSLSIVFIAMWIADKQLHLISLAGISLSVGLIVDASIITIESIQRELKRKFSFEYMYKGLMRVRSALISSTLTSVLIFIPIVLMSSKEGQLFEDLAFVISIALMASLVYSLYVLPALCTAFNIENRYEIKSQEAKSYRFVTLFSNPALAMGYIVLGVLFTVCSVMFFRPELDVLPNPQVRDVTAFVRFEKNLSARAIERQVADPINKAILTSIENNTAPEFDYFTQRCVARGCFLNFATNKNIPVEIYDEWLNSTILASIVGVSGSAEKEALLELALPNHRAIEVDLIGPELSTLTRVGVELMAYLTEKLQGAEVFENSEIVKSDVVIEFTPEKEKLAFVDMSVQQLNNYLVAMSYGYYIGDYFNEGRAVAAYVKGHEVTSVDDLLSREIITPDGNVRSLGELTQGAMKPSDSLIMRVNSEQVASLYIEAPETMPIGKFITILKGHVADFFEQKQVFDVAVQYRGSTDDMGTFMSEFAQILAISIVILFGLIWWFIKSAKATLVVMLSLPISMAGGLLAVYLFGLIRYQNLDMITIIGFIMLMGLVINNGILLVSSFMDNLALSASRVEAISSAISHRKRAILLSTLTSILGMMPLLLPGATSSEIYQGLAVVIIGGMLTNITLGLLLMVALLSLPWVTNQQDATQLIRKSA